MKKFLKDYFTFNKGDRHGIIVLCFIIFALMFCLSIIHSLSPATTVDFRTFDKLVAELERAEKEAEQLKNTAFGTFEQKKNSYVASESQFSTSAQTLFQFDPNNLPEEKWKALGLSEKQIKIIKHYEEKGGKFYKKEDVKKIYGIQEKLYAQLEPFIHIPGKEPRDSSGRKWKDYKRDTLYKRAELPQKPLPTVSVELNSADTLKLKNLKGIGSAFAKRILAYREKLGGFLSFRQLYEVWGVDSETVKTIIPQLTLDPAMVRKIPLNHCNVSDLKKHPYLNYNIANNIVLYRDRHGDYAKVQDIKQAVLVNEELFRKIAPYLTLE